MTTYCGTTKIHSRKLSILWTGENAQHIAEHHFKDPGKRPLHIEIQKALQQAQNFHYIRFMYMGLKEESGYTMRIIWQKRGKLAEIKSAINLATTANKLVKSKGVGAAPNKNLSEEITLKDISDAEKEFLKESNLNPEKYVDILNRFNQVKKRHSKK
jgi:hypothetical protein